MKLTKLHLFLLLLVVLLFSSMGFGVLEGNENIGDSSTSITSNTGSSNSESKSNDTETKKHSYSLSDDVRIDYKQLSTQKKPMGFGSNNGIKKSEIPPGDEHLYVLKSEIVPPVCPKCPETSCPSGKNGKNGGGVKEDCPPCPRPQRCPEPAFTCKKVPNYSASAVDNVLPSPMFMQGSGMNTPRDTGMLNGTAAGAGKGGDPMPLLNSFAKFT